VRIENWKRLNKKKSNLDKNVFYGIRTINLVVSKPNRPFSIMQLSTKRAVEMQPLID